MIFCIISFLFNIFPFCSWGQSIVFSFHLDNNDILEIDRRMCVIYITCVFWLTFLLFLEKENRSLSILRMLFRNWLLIPPKKRKRNWLLIRVKWLPSPQTLARMSCAPVHALHRGLLLCCVWVCPCRRINP